MYVHFFNVLLFFTFLILKMHVVVHASRTPGKCEYLWALGSAEPKCLNVGSRKMDEPSGRVSSGARRKCAKRKGRASYADVVWEWQPLENGRIFSDPSVVRTILKRGRTTALASFKPRIFDRDGVKYGRNAIHIVWI